MPSKPKANALNSRFDPNPSAEEPEPATPAADTDSGARVGRKKNKHAATKRHESTERPSEPELTRDPSPSFKGQSLLGQIPRSFPPARPPLDDDVLEDLNATEKVSDEHTPPQDAVAPSANYGRSPPELIPGLSYAASPPAQHAYIGKGGFNTRSPPTSPPQAKARPVSYGGRPSSNYGYPRLSTSPYGHPIPAYGSPPALPHLPQQHFYNPQDVDLRVGARPPSAKAQPPSLIKLARFPGSISGCQDALFVGSGPHLDILSYNGEKLDPVGSLTQLPGIVHDAVFLTWTSGNDPLRELRPLVALALHDAASLEQDAEDRPSSRLSNSVSAMTGPMISVIVFSLQTQSPIAELLRAPMGAQQQLPSVFPDPGTSAKDRLSLQASGDHLVVSSAVSGEVFVFGMRSEETGSGFDCLTKLWTSRQPRLQRRDSSHGRPAEADMSPADLSRGERGELPAIVSLNGRWLSYCPAASSSTSIGASLGSSVLVSNSFTIASRSAPSRPTVNCEVESPDAETLLSKVAKGAAQSLVRGSKWLGEMGMQAWRNWNTDPALNAPQAATHRSPVYSPQLAPSPFPPTHGEPVDQSLSEPETVSVIDLQVLPRGEGKKGSEPTPTLATFQPPGGCSFISFAPNGLSLLTASRKGDVQYVWDLFQIRHPRTTVTPTGTAAGAFSSRVRQLAKFERFSPSSIVDVQWESPLGNRFATLTQNRTIHMYDLPANALRWPPPRKAKKPRPVSAPAEKPDTSQQSTSPLSFLASARNIANRTQPMLANLRGRTPSVTGGVSGIGSSGIGLASATGMRGGKVVAAGFSKSLGAATDTVAHIRHAGQSKLHLKLEAAAGRLVWREREGRTLLCVLDASGIKNYYVRKTNPRERQLETVSVFDARKAVAYKLPEGLGPSLEQMSIQDVATTQEDENNKRGFWKPETLRQAANNTANAPLSHAEIETNAPYQPFHSDHRVSMSIYADASQMTESNLPTVSVLFQPQGTQNRASAPDRWVFGGDIPTLKLNITPALPQQSEQRVHESIVYRETTFAQIPGDDEAEQIVSTTRRRKAKKRGNDAGDSQVLGEGQEEFFEDELEVLDFAADRV